MKKYILHSVLGDVREYATKEALKNDINLICWGAGVKFSIIKDLDLNYHAFLFDNNGRFIVINGGEISVPSTSTPEREASRYILNLPNFKSI